MASNLFCFSFLLIRIDKATQLYFSFKSFYTDLERIKRRLFKYCSFYIGSDCRIVQIFTSSFFTCHCSA